jgi:hypothetical protein
MRRLHVRLSGPSAPDAFLPHGKAKLAAKAAEEKARAEAAKKTDAGRRSGKEEK